MTKHYRTVDELKSAIDEIVRHCAKEPDIPTAVNRSLGRLMREGWDSKSIARIKEGVLWILDMRGG